MDDIGTLDDVASQPYISPSPERHRIHSIALKTQQSILEVGLYLERFIGLPDHYIVRATNAIGKDAYPALLMRECSDPDEAMSRALLGYHQVISNHFGSWAKRTNFDETSLYNTIAENPEAVWYVGATQEGTSIEHSFFELYSRDGHEFRCVHDGSGIVSVRVAGNPHDFEERLRENIAENAHTSSYYLWGGFQDQPLGEGVIDPERKHNRLAVVGAFPYHQSPGISSIVVVDPYNNRRYTDCPVPTHRIVPAVQNLQRNQPENLEETAALLTQYRVA